MLRRSPSLPVHPVHQSLAPFHIKPRAGKLASGGRSPEDRAAPDHGRRTPWPKPRRAGEEGFGRKGTVLIAPRSKRSAKT
ncbi:hypothetical protein NL676_031479 [Syzygium grande]|nr:hypothetical protein NL676_031479 [Syzygium grande]